MRPKSYQVDQRVRDNFRSAGDSLLQLAHQSVGDLRGALSQGQGRYEFGVPGACAAEINLLRKRRIGPYSCDFSANRTTMHLKIVKIWPRFSTFSLRSFLPRRLLVHGDEDPPAADRLRVGRFQTLVLLGHEGPCFVHLNDRGSETTNVLSGKKVPRREEAGRMAASSRRVKRMVCVHSAEAITSREPRGGW